MTVGDALVRIRKERNLTQEGLARKLFVTRQAVSRWENGETSPSIDMCKLIAATCDVPVTELLEMPDAPYCQSCGMPFFQPEDRGTKADGTPSEDFCSWCYRDGTFVGGVARRAYRALRSRHGRDMWHLARRGRLLHGRPSPRPQALGVTWAGRGQRGNDDGGSGASSPSCSLTSRAGSGPFAPPR